MPTRKLRYGDIARELAQHIATGTYPVGSVLPTELELGERYGTSRHTVRAALNELQLLGLISRRRNAGTRVESREAVGRYQQALASVDDLAQFGATHVRKVRKVEPIVADIDLARELGCPGGTRWLRISSIRTQDASSGGTPIGWTDVYLDPDYAEIARQVRKEPQTLVSTLIEARYGRRIARLQQEIDAIELPPALADELKAAAGSPALKVVRRYYDVSNVAFEITVTVHPAGRYTFLTQLRRA